MIVFYDPSNGNQVMAVYSHDTTSKAWTDAGYVRAEVDEAIRGEAMRAGRDAKVVLDGQGRVRQVVPSPNPVQPAPNPKNLRLKELQDKLKADTATLSEMREMLRLERGL